MVAVMELTQILLLLGLFLLFSLALFPKNLHFKTVILKTFSVYNIVPKGGNHFSYKILVFWKELFP